MPSKNSRLERLQQALVFAKRKYDEAFERVGQRQNRENWISDLTPKERKNLPPESDEDDYTWSPAQKEAHYTWELMQELHDEVRRDPEVQQVRKRVGEARAAVEAEQERIERRAAHKRAKEEQLKKLAAEEAQKKAKREAAHKRKRRAKAAVPTPPEQQQQPRPQPETDAKKQGSPSSADTKPREQPKRNILKEALEGIEAGSEKLPLHIVKKRVERWLVDHKKGDVPVTRDTLSRALGRRK
jgi:hypothetical protein